jgi:hypothetical protein
METNSKQVLCSRNVTAQAFDVGRVTGTDRGQSPNIEGRAEHKKELERS